MVIVAGECEEAKKLSAEMSPVVASDVLIRLYHRFDELADKHDLFNFILFNTLL